MSERCSSVAAKKHEILRADAQKRMNLVDW